MQQTHNWRHTNVYLFRIYIFLPVSLELGPKLAFLAYIELLDLLLWKMSCWCVYVCTSNHKVLFSCVQKSTGAHVQYMHTRFWLSWHEMCETLIQLFCRMKDTLENIHVIFWLVSCLCVCVDLFAFWWNWHYSYAGKWFCNKINGGASMWSCVFWMQVLNRGDQ